MSGLKVLITNHAMASRGGTEMYVYDLAIALQKLGHRPYVYTPVLGKLGRELEALTIPVCDCLENLTFVPDIIHGHHHLPTMAALTRFPEVPAIFFCHGWTPQEEHPPLFPRILRYGAVSQACYDRLIMNGVSEEKIQLLLNFVDLNRFKPSAQRSEKLKRALIFSNHASEKTWVPVVRQACARMDVSLDVIGAGTGRPVDDPENVLGDYDLVFAVGKAALESLAAGASVVVCDYGRIGPLVSMKNVSEMRQKNFGLRALVSPLSTEALCREMSSYNLVDAQEVSRYVRETACKDKSIDQIILLYQNVLSEYAMVKGSEEMYLELNAISKYLTSFARVDRHWHDKLIRIEHKFQLIERCYRFLVGIPIFGRLLRYALT